MSDRFADPADLDACRRSIRGGSKSFYAASLLLPPVVRERAYALYGFCRRADDLVDRGGDARAACDVLEARLEAIYAGRPGRDPVDRAFADLVRACDIPEALPDALLEGFAWDASGMRYDTISQLRAYAARVAGTVGVMMALGMGARSEAALSRVVYTGYLRRDVPEPEAETADPYICVTTGGGGDGARLIDWVLSAYEYDRSLAPRAVLVYGPFMAAEHRAEFDARAEALGERITVLRFASYLERLMAESAGIIAMGGYNTFCEILSVDRPAIIAPRVKPRREQLIRARAAEHLGLVRMLHEPRDGASPAVMATAIRALATQRRPSVVQIPGLLSGLETIAARYMRGRPARLRAR